MKKQFWRLLLVLLLASCGQPLPLQRGTPTAVGELSATVEGVPEASSVATNDPVVATPELEASTATVPAQVTQGVPTPGVVETPVVVVVPTVPARTSAEAWAAQQAAREDFGGERRYTATAPVILFWYDPVSGMNMEVGRLIGEFVATAQFQLVSQQNVSALAVPYRVNQDYGLTAISPVVAEKMRAAGYTDQVEGFVLLGDTTVPAAAAGEPWLVQASASILASSHQRTDTQRL